MSRFADRELWDVDVSFSSTISDPGTVHARPVIGANASISLKALSGNFGGPSVDVALAVDPMPTASILEVEEAVLVATYDLLTRVVAGGLEGLRTARQTALGRDMVPFSLDLSSLDMSEPE